MIAVFGNPNGKNDIKNGKNENGAPGLQAGTPFVVSRAPYGDGGRVVFSSVVFSEAGSDGSAPGSASTVCPVISFSFGSASLPASPAIPSAIALNTGAQSVVGDVPSSLTTVTAYVVRPTEKYPQNQVR
ncbi:MAG: hypothetical protein IJL26_00960, partial [Clostridia bacterium]|nr:hypothetical protein [Clostridia bacterium]